LKVPNDLDTKDKLLNTNIYRALVLIYEYCGNVKKMRHYFKLWQNENPDDPDMASEWERVTEKYQL
jgi:hypothetical protein